MILVTGANGFVGAAILRALSEKGAGAIALTRPGRVGPVLPGVEQRVVDAWDEASLSRAVDGASAVIHAASVVHRPGADADFNREGTRALHAAMRAAGVPRLVFLSTIKVYGESAPPRLDEDTTEEPETPYAHTKLEAERFLLGAADGPSPIVLRLCPVFGRGDKGNVRTMIRAIWRRRFLLPGDGSTRKSLVHATTVAEAAIAAARSPVRGTFVLADREAPTMRRRADTIARALGRRRPLAAPAPLLLAAAFGVEALARAVRRSPPVTRDLLRKSMTPTICSPARLGAALGLDLHVDLDAAIDDEVAWMRAERLL